MPVVWWWSCAESFLSLTSRLPAEVLVVEGWIGYAGIRAAAAEFEERGYQYVVVTGGLPEEGWVERRLSYAEMAERELIRSGVAQEKIIAAPVEDIQRQRTYQSAVAVWKALQARNAQPKALNVFTLGPHARRSFAVFTKVFWPTTNVGVVSWVPSGYWAAPWWRSSARAKELLTETPAYLYEELLNSGRGSNSQMELTEASWAQAPKYLGSVQRAARQLSKPCYETIRTSEMEPRAKVCEGTPRETDREGYLVFGIIE